MLSSNVSVTLAMIIYELATNALKFGALSMPEGLVSVNWSTQSIADKMHLIVDWRESNGPTVTQPKRSGFGMFMLGCRVELGLSGNCDRSFSPDGFVCLLKIPL